MHERLHFAHAAEAWRAVRKHPLLFAIAPAAMWAGTGAFLDTISFLLAVNPFTSLPFVSVAAILSCAPVLFLAVWTQGTLLHVGGMHAREQDTHIGHGIAAATRALPTLLAIHLVAGCSALLALVIAWGMRHGGLLAALPVHMHTPLAAIFLIAALFLVLNWQWLALAYAAQAPQHISFKVAARAAWYGLTRNAWVLLEHNILLLLVAFAAYAGAWLLLLFFPLMLAAPAFLLSTQTGFLLPIATVLPVLRATIIIGALSGLTAWASVSWACLAHRMLGERLPSSFWRTIRLYLGQEQ
jgi:hypothetical protein